MKTKVIPLAEAFAKATKGPLKLIAFTTPREDEDPMGVYEVEPDGGTIQQRFDDVSGGDTQAEEDEATKQWQELHEENAMTAVLLGHAYTVLQETVEALKLAENRLWERRDMAEDCGNIEMANLINNEGDIIRGALSKALAVEVPSDS